MGPLYIPTIEELLGLNPNGEIDKEWEFDAALDHDQEQDWSRDDFLGDL